MINCGWWSNLRRFIAYQDESRWLNVRTDVHAVIASDDTTVVNGT